MSPIITHKVPNAFFLPCSHGGEVCLIQYESKNYLQKSQGIQKSAYIYLPMSFKPSDNWDVLYLLHGWTENNSYFLNQKECVLKNILDHMIQDRCCRPFVVVSPTWDIDNEEKEWEDSCNEVRCFHQEYLQDLIPNIERYVRGGDIIDVRAHWEKRAIGGFSLGAIASWYIFQYAFGMQKFYIPMSGECWIEGENENPEEVYRKLLKGIEQSPHSNDEYQIHSAIGGRDSRRRKVLEQATYLSNLPDIHKNAHFDLYLKEDGWHAYASVWEYLYNILPQIYPVIR